MSGLPEDRVMAWRPILAGLAFALPLWGARLAAAWAARRLWP